MRGFYTRRHRFSRADSGLLLTELTFLDAVLAFTCEDRLKRSGTIVYNDCRRPAMRSLMQFFSRRTHRQTNGLEPTGGGRIRRRLLATAALLALGCTALSPALIARDRHDDGRWVGTWSASPQAV